MNAPLPTVYLVRHGETAWSLSGQHTGVTDLPLTERGRANAERLRARLQGLTVGKVLTSPLQRAIQTCEIAGFKGRAEIDPDLIEWNYGQYEGRTTAEIRAERPGWHLFRDGCPGGESLAQVAARAERVVRRLKAFQDDTLIFSSRHILTVLAAVWLGLDPSSGRFLYLNTASVSALGYDHSLSEPAIRLWNDVHHLEN